MDLDELKIEWELATGAVMPVDIARLPIDKIRRAVGLVREGATVVVPRAKIDRYVETEETVTSLREWDRDSEF